MYSSNRNNLVFLTPGFEDDTLIQMGGAKENGFYSHNILEKILLNNPKDLNISLVREDIDLLPLLKEYNITHEILMNWLIKDLITIAKREGISINKGMKKHVIAEKIMEKVYDNNKMKPYKPDDFTKGIPTQKELIKMTKKELLEMWSVPSKVSKKPKSVIIRYILLSLLKENNIDLYNKLLKQAENGKEPEIPNCL